MVRIAWRLDPAVAVHLPGRFKSPLVEREVGRWVRAHTRDVLDVPEAIKFLLADRLGFNVARDLKVCIYVVKHENEDTHSYIIEHFIMGTRHSRCCCDVLRATLSKRSSSSTVCASRIG